MAEFPTKVKNPVKLPSVDVLTNSIHGLRKRAREEMDPDKRYRLKMIQREMSWLRKQLL